jgi:hypothetical protein
VKVYRVRYDRNGRDYVDQVVYAANLDEAFQVAIGRSGVDVTGMSRTITLPNGG